MYIDTDDGVKTPVLDACMFLFCLLKLVDGEKFIRRAERLLPVGARRMAIE